MADWRAAYRGRTWTGPECIGGRDFRIMSVRQGAFENTKGTNIAVVSSNGEEREWVICKTNGFCLAALFGPDTDGWVGKVVTVYFDESVRGQGGDVVGGIRVTGSPSLDRPIIAKITLRGKTTQHRLIPTGRQSDTGPDLLVGACEAMGITVEALDAVTPEGRPVPSTLQGERRGQVATWLKGSQGAERVEAARAWMAQRQGGT